MLANGSLLADKTYLSARTSSRPQPENMESSRRGPREARAAGRLRVRARERRRPMPRPRRLWRVRRKGRRHQRLTRPRLSQKSASATRRHSSMSARRTNTSTTPTPVVPSVRPGSGLPPRACQPTFRRSLSPWRARATSHARVPCPQRPRRRDPQMGDAGRASGALLAARAAGRPPEARLRLRRRHGALCAQARWWWCELMAHSTSSITIRARTVRADLPRYDRAAYIAPRHDNVLGEALPAAPHLGSARKPPEDQAAPRRR